MIKIVKLEKKYNNFIALKSISLEIHDGEFVAITGKSGSGKTTLLNILGLLDEEYNGEYFVDEILVNNLKNKEKSKLRGNSFGFIFQEYYLDLDLTVYQNLEIPFLIRKEKKKKYDAIIKEKLSYLGILDKIKNRAKDLSGGEKQRVAIARALMNKPKILLADEPTGALDSVNSKVILDYLKDINDKGFTVILVTHNMEEANLANRIITIKDGEIISDEKK